MTDTLECCICFDTIKYGKYHKQSSCCGKVFHWKCMMEWCRTKYLVDQLDVVEKDSGISCPMCRTVNKVIDCAHKEDYILPEGEFTEKEADKKYVINYLSKRIDINHIVTRREKLINIRLIYSIINENMSYFIDSKSFIEVMIERMHIFEENINNNLESSKDQEIIDHSNRTKLVLNTFKDNLKKQKELVIPIEV